MPVPFYGETDFTDDLKAIDLPVLLLHGDDDQIVPVKASALKSVALLRQGTLKVYPGAGHGMASTHAEQVNVDILAFLEGELVAAVNPEERGLEPACPQCAGNTQRLRSAPWRGS